ncbi:MAG: thiamine pyrophosphate-binding protein [Myxococcales bacterium]|nr:thiamine pyrophosphate-binding protein [Myxococcales bacterium]
MMERNGGSIIGEELARAGIRSLFTLCGGHISPILTGAKAQGIRVVDMRDEVSAVFAADAVARMTGVPGVAAVTAGPGVTNTVTAVKNAQMAQSPVLIFGGATATVLKGRGSLQDIDQLALMGPITKWATSVNKVSALAPTVARALEIARSGVPGPVFVEVPVDLLYPESLVHDWFMKESGVANAKGLGAKALELYLKGHLLRQFHAPHVQLPLPIPELRLPRLGVGDRVEEVAALLRRAERPAIIVGSQALVNSREPERIADALRSLGAPVWLGGMARGLLGQRSELQFRHKRSAALKEADVVIVAGFPFDFRLGYGRSISKKATLAAANLSRTDLHKNREPELALEMHAGDLLVQLAARLGDPPQRWEGWFETLRAREEARDAEIAAKGEAGEGRINPIHFFHRLEEKMDPSAVMVVDGGDFVATAAYIVRPRAPLSWLDPGVFGTLGVGGGFATGAAVVRPESEIWLIYGDGSSAYSLAEFDTYVRHGLAPIAVIGTDGSWAQIAREQVEILGDDIGTVLRRTDYHRVAEGYGGIGLLLEDPAKVDEILEEAKAHARAGRPVCLNVQIESSDFRKGSISM